MASYLVPGEGGRPAIVECIRVVNGALPERKERRQIMKTIIIALVAFGVLFWGCHQEAMSNQTMSNQTMTNQTMSKDHMEKIAMEQPKKTDFAVFAGGCFWCVTADFEKVPGVITVISGYTGGHVVNPTYEEVSAGGTGDVEAVKVIYDPNRVSYEKLLDWFWRHVDPTDPDGQFVDRGPEYRSEIFYANPTQKRLAEASKAWVAAHGPFTKPIVTKIVALGTFYPAEAYHQDYYKKYPIRYPWFRAGSGRDQFLKKTWAHFEGNIDPESAMAKSTDMEKTGEASGTMKTGSTDMGTSGKSSGMMKTGSDTMTTGAQASTMGDSGTMAMWTAAMASGEQVYTRPSKAELKKRLTPMEYEVTQEDGTEPAFHNAYWNNHAPGIYVDIVSGEPLFSSTDKFDSGTGWPSFTKPLVPGNIVEKTDRTLWITRTEVRSRHAGSHLGHVFKDGPPPTGLRYCIDSAALRFVPADKLAAEGYGQFAKLFH